MRLLWSESAAPPPDIVVAKDLSSVYEEHHEYLAACSGPPSARLIESRTVSLARFVWVGGGTRIPDGAAPDRTLEVGSTQVEIFEPSADLPALPIWPGYVSASWSRDGQLASTVAPHRCRAHRAGRAAGTCQEPGELEIDDWSVLAGASSSSIGVASTTIRLSYDVEGENTAPVIDPPGRFGRKCRRRTGRRRGRKPRSCTSSRPGRSSIGASDDVYALRGRATSPARGSPRRSRPCPPTTSASSSLVHANAIELELKRRSVGPTTVTPGRAHGWPVIVGQAGYVAVWSTAGSAGSSTKARC